MSKLDSHLIINNSGIANIDNIYSGEGYRLTIITDRLVRVEINKNNEFNDLITQAVWCRDLGKVNYEIINENDKLLIKTKKATFYYDEKKKELNYVILKNEII